MKSVYISRIFGYFFIAAVFFLFAGCRTVHQTTVRYGIGSWSNEALGNHRAIVHVPKNAHIVRAHIPWRRKDYTPEKKNVVIIDAKTEKRIMNVTRVAINREYCELIFEPATSPGDYYVYYMPNKTTPLPYPNTIYDPWEETANPEWVKKNKLTAEMLRDGTWQKLPTAHVVEIQARTEFDSFSPMEIVATSTEMSDLLNKYPNRSYLVFPEDRLHPIRMTNDLPLRWIETGPRPIFSAKTDRGEFFTFQLGVYAAKQDLKHITIEFAEMTMRSADPIPASLFKCFNLGGSDFLGRPFTKEVYVERGKVQALWFGVQIPKNAKPGTYRGSLTLHAENAEDTPITLSFCVSPHVLEDSGDSELWRLSRLRWLDSTTGIDNEVVAPYQPLEVKGQTISCLGREVTFNRTGLPTSMKSWFPMTVDAIGDKSTEILSNPIEFIVETEGKNIEWAGGILKILEQAPGAVTWESTITKEPFRLICRARMECDGYINYWLTLTSDRTERVSDVRLEVPIRRDVATYMMGLGSRGGYRPGEWKWQWDVNRTNNLLWIGDVNAGLWCKLKHTKEHWNIRTLRDSGIYREWGNEGKGGCTVKERGTNTVLFSAYNGERTIHAGEELHYNFALLITPVKSLDPAHWNWRYYQNSNPPDTTPTSRWIPEALDGGANIITIHHANEYNPFINYPFITADTLTAYVKKVHNAGLKAKIYYSGRELSNRAAEFWAIRSLGDEITFTGTEGFRINDYFTGYPWFCEHLKYNQDNPIPQDYVPAWHSKTADRSWDAALTTVGLSRWHNYYVESIAWLLKNTEIDGIYLDDIDYDREIIKRVRKTMDELRPGSLIDFHSHNNLNTRWGMTNSACRYLEHFPYFNSIWFGEAFNYDESSPDYWLVEISGIPFGIYSEMLGNNPNPWRGMIYGMSTYLQWAGSNPTSMWKLWDDFGIQNSRMIGYWAPSCPIKTNNKNILATAYVKRDKVLVSLASWAEGEVRCRLMVDWESLGLHPDKTRIYAPQIKNVQEAADFDAPYEISVLPKRGWLLIIEEK